jgi:hypothetical protein
MSRIQMKQYFSAIGSKLHHSFQFALYCFSERGKEIKEARMLYKFAMGSMSFFSESTREDIGGEDIEPFLGHILGVYYSSIGHHDAVQKLALSGHSLDSLILLRTQLETILAFFYLTEPHDNLLEIFKRTERHRHWIAVKMKQNMDESLKLNLLPNFINEDYRNSVNRNYDIVLKEYSTSPQEIKNFEKASSFLTRHERETIASKFGIEGFYNHIFAESSASIHFADIGDRMQQIEPGRFRYTTRNAHTAFWPLMLSNLLQVKCIQQFGKFFGVEPIITPRLQDIMSFKGVKN